MAVLTDSAPDIAPAEEWSRAAMLVDLMRYPADWFTQIRERILIEDDNIARVVDLRILAPYDEKDLPSEILVPLLRPRKGMAHHLELMGETQETARILRHVEHKRVSRFIVIQQFREMLRSLSAERDLEPADGEALAESLRRMLLLIDEPPRSSTALAPLDDLFDQDGWLRTAPRRNPSPRLNIEMARLFQLCQEVCDRYFKILAVSRTSSEFSLEYKYAQESEGRTYGNVVLRWFRRSFRAPAPALRVHIPLARSTDDYELTMESVPGYYVAGQQVIEREADGRHESDERPSLGNSSGEDTNVAWWSTPRGGHTTAILFVGGGSSAHNRLQAGIRLAEIPPGATGRAWAILLIGTMVLLGVISWGLLHNLNSSSIAPELLVTLVAFGSAVVDNITPTRQLFNSPLLPRLVLFLQTVNSILVALWLLTRATANDATGLLAGVLAQIDGLDHGRKVLQVVDLSVGLVLAAFNVFLFVWISVRAGRALRAYDNTMAQRGV